MGTVGTAGVGNRRYCSQRHNCGASCAFGPDLWPYSPGSWADSKAQKFQKVAGQTLSVRCQYSPKSVTYQRKSWCRETSVSLCTMLVTSSTPWTLVQASRFSIWDNPSAGFFIVTMENLKEEDSGHYWCAMYHTSSNSVFKSVKLYLSVSPGKPLPQPSRHTLHSSLCLGASITPDFLVIEASFSPVLVFWEG
jgi:hypothetical protein